MASQSFIAWEQLPWLPHERHLAARAATRGQFKSFIVPRANPQVSVPIMSPNSHLPSPNSVVTGERHVADLGWWDDHQRALRPDQGLAATRCGFLLLAIIDGNAAAVCAAV